eukprot:422349-Amphidinium_carterae.1
MCNAPAPRSEALSCPQDICHARHVVGAMCYKFHVMGPLLHDTRAVNLSQAFMVKLYALRCSKVLVNLSETDFSVSVCTKSSCTGATMLAKLDNQESRQDAPYWQIFPANSRIAHTETLAHGCM